MARHMIVPTPEALAKAEWKYVNTAIPVRDIIVDLGWSQGTFYNRLKVLGWPPRRPLGATFRAHIDTVVSNAAAGNAARASTEPAGTAGDPSAPDSTPDSTPAPPGGDMAAQVATTVAREIAAIDAILARLKPADDPGAQAERAARTLASLTRTLNEVRRLHVLQSPPAMPADTDPDDDMPADLDEFRRDLARRIDAFVAARSDASVCDPGDEPPA